MALQTPTNAADATIVLAGATGDLGGRIAASLLARGVRPLLLVRPGSKSSKLNSFREQGATIFVTDFKSVSELAKACAGATCVVSALSGLEEVILETQRILLLAAVEAGVPRFIPSDFSIDFTKIPAGTNRNLDLRREFGERLDKAPIRATSILNGMFADLLTGQAPVVLFPLKKVVYWGDANQLLDYTTIQDTAAYTAAAALDAETPRYLRIAGDTLHANGLCEAASKATGNEFSLLRAGGLGRLDALIKFTRTVFPQRKEVFPAWQGMQYLRNMYSGHGKLEPLDNNRYPAMHWTSVQEVLQNR
ncbi:NmrA family NAD(P)-binding protein [Pontibacter sp. SGAir0037]|uniref:NmrA family NAD(P)-binding protein n=1 Tax=Pontibacter sp. SGAir0037 TaxID=2571030 RepID=UPI0010CCDC20|nr:NmrA family NAD(P)-binding protein [Pontibacter sp. SGAir0037]QCR22467.1 NmrA family protein [Pontibacter sp. SGAir0037]